MNALARIELVESLLADAGVDARRLREASARAERTGTSLEDVLYQTKEITRNDLVHARILRADGQRVVMHTAQELPDADLLIHVDAPGQPKLLAIADRADPAKRFFVVHDGNPAASQLQNAVAAAAKAGYVHAGTLEAAQSLIGLYHSRVSKVAGEPDLSRQPAAGGEEVVSEFFDLAHVAYKRGASDIHLSAERGHGTVRFRVDGDLETYRDYTEEHIARMVRAVFNTEHETGSTQQDFDPRELQNAIISHDYADVRLRFRYSGLPLVSESEAGGFDSTLRIIPVGQALSRRNPGDLGYAPSQLDMLGRALSRSSGIVLFVGITGSGKSTSLASFFSMIAEHQQHKKIVSVEDPIEYIIPGVKQTIAGPDKFNTVLRQILRSDPDRVIVGEIRDRETAELAIQATRTGHMVASTLHADSAPTAYSRLAGMGIPYAELAGSGLISAVVYQSLLKTLCPHCRIPAENWATSNPSDKIIERLKRERFAGRGLVGVYFQNSLGCKHCKGGKTGRTVCAEVLTPTTALLAAIATGDSTAIWREWRSKTSTDVADMTGRTAFEHALFKMANGIVSPHEVESAFRWVDEPAWDGEAE